MRTGDFRRSREAAAAMAEIPFVRVVSVTSADPRHPAENLLRPEDGGRWRGAAAGEKQMSVVLELGDPRPIHSLHVGNDGAAFVEVLLGSSAGGDFQVLLPSAALMSPSESRAGAGPGRVRLFGPEALVKRPATPTARWDRLQVVLSQPYCQSRPYGLSFIRVFAAPEEGEEPPPAPRRRLGPFTLREEGEGSPGAPPGALFYSRPPSPPPQPPAQTPPGPSYATAALQGSAGDGTQPPKRRPPSPTPPPPPTNGAAPKKPKTKTPPKTDKPRPSPAPRAPKKPGTAPQKPGTPPQKTRDPPQSPVLGGVVLALSGFQNPLRAHLRAAAAALGAEYRPDWTPECTHLVCAFARTPKAARGAAAGGVVVAPGWIWACQREGRRLSCGPYLLDGPASSSSDGEGPDDAPPPSRPSPKVKKGAGPTHLGHTWDPSPHSTSTPPESGDSDGQSEDSDPYGGSTEENSEDEEGEGEPIPPLPDFFEDKKFFLHGDFPEGEGRRLRRFVVAFGGSLAPSLDASVTHVVTSQDWDPAFQEALKLRPSLVFVRPHWLLLCGERQRPLPAQPFLVTSAMTSSA
ncbi:LOW QUALITY PROTEIN: DNA repair protein XRCC1 [Vidua macroura]|uniref:LOW QUALITY PROTEIN: DNA repair protein XRCC1 n=1 Tax=Vidua macroura TaxID=187451 RepID=UPI0023A8A791|nr:LOW QUALITY PROTEIN: DNA repair protein XRCC1 [Vidua macroura]